MGHSSTREIEAYNRANASLLRLIRGEQFASRSRTARRRRADAKLERIRKILRVLGDPQRRYPIVHVTGTSGKGSTAAAVASVLTASGYRVGLRTSPYLQVATEKLQIGSSLIDASSFDMNVQRVLEEAFRLFPTDQTGSSMSYAEAWAVLGYWWFAERHVDIAVVEVGAGGRFDATNVIDPIVSVITSVSMDHIVALGPTITDIAWHKAGIIKPGAPVVVGAIPDEALQVIVQESASVGANLIEAFRLEAANDNFLSRIEGDFRCRNARVAAAVVEVLRGKGFRIPDAALMEGIRTARLPGRLELMPGQGDVPVWIDGAHNAEKIAAVAQEAMKISSNGSLPVIVLGLLNAKDPATMLSAICGVASHLVLTEPNVLGRRSVQATALANLVIAHGFRGGVYVEPGADAAISRALSLAKSERTSVLTTGSMFLAGQVRQRWYPNSDIVIQRTPWPAPAAAGLLHTP